MRAPKMTSPARRRLRAGIVRRVHVLELDRALSVEQDGRFTLGVGEMIPVGGHQCESARAKAQSRFPVQPGAHRHEQLARDDRDVDIYETENELVLKADLPDVELKDIDVRVENQTLTIAGERKFEKNDSVKGYHRLERSYGRFTRSFAVPSSFDTENIAAGYKNGVLSVSLPKKEAAKPRQIKIEVKA